MNTTTHLPIPLTDVYKNVNQVSFRLFVVIGFVQLISSLLVANQISTRINWLVSRLLDFPFFFVAFLYFATSIRLNLYPRKLNFTLVDSILTIVGIGLLSTLQFYDLFTTNLLP